MRVALIGNMNNNYFSLMRYLRDEGIEADLFTLQDEYSHFAPECDTWNIEKWRQHIKSVPFTYYNTIDNIRAFDREETSRLFAGYDLLIGSGPTPAYLARAGLRLDVFIPYKTGIEYYKDNISLRNPVHALRTRLFNREQRTALRSTPIAINCDFRDDTFLRIAKLNMKNIALPLPMVYLEESASRLNLESGYESAIRRIEESDYVVCHPGRHIWQRRWTTRLKGTPFHNNNANDKVVLGFQELLLSQATCAPLLVLFEYGPQVESTKQLIKSLGICDSILWLPLSPRKIVMEIVRRCTIGIGDLVVGSWGGKSVEFIANGVPVVNPISEEYRMRYCSNLGHSPPPFIQINSPNDLGRTLVYFARHPEERLGYARASRQWFLEHDGVAAAREIKKLMLEILRSKGVNKNG